MQVITQRTGERIIGRTTERTVAAARAISSPAAAA
jgi:hypothetical protein